MSSEDSPSKDSDSKVPSITAGNTVAAEQFQEESPPENGPNQTESEESAVKTAPEETPPAVSTAETPEETPRRIRLNPKLVREQDKAVPSLHSSGSAVETPSVDAESTESSASGEVESTEQARSAASSPSSPLESDPEVETSAQSPAIQTQTPVELPPEIKELGADLEAEIEAAMSDDSQRSISENIPATETETTALPEEESLEEGTRLNGKIQSIHGDDVFLDLGYRSPGVVSQRQFETGKKPDVGQIIEVVVDRVNQEEGLILVNLPKGLRRARGNWDDLDSGQIIDCMVTKSNKGGLEITVGNIRGFLPASQVDFSFVSDLDSYIGQKLRVKIIEANRKKRNLVVSRRQFLQIERKEAEQELWKTLKEGTQFTGTVKSIKDYGAFIDIGGVDGFLHIGEISWSRIKHPSEVLQEGQQVEVKVLKLDPEKKKISLGMRQLAPNPWTTATVNYSADTTVSGKVTRITDFGAFVELEPGLEGMVHISELDYKRVKRVSDLLEVGQKSDFKVLEVDPDRKRISLSLKALREKPEEKTSQTDSPETKAVPQRKSKNGLKGGTGTKGSGLFGNPKDFQ